MLLMGMAAMTTTTKLTDKRGNGMLKEAGSPFRRYMAGNDHAQKKGQSIVTTLHVNATGGSNACKNH